MKKKVFTNYKKNYHMDFLKNILRLIFLWHQMKTKRVQLVEIFFTPFMKNRLKNPAKVN